MYFFVSHIRSNYLPFFYILYHDSEYTSICLTIDIIFMYMNAIYEQLKKKKPTLLDLSGS